MHHPCLRPGIVNSQLDEADQLLGIKGSNKDARIKVCRTHVTDSLKALSIVRKQPSLTNWALVVNLPESARECIVKRDLSDHNPLLLCLLGFVSRLEPDLLCPPLLKGGDIQDRHIVPFHWIGVFRSGLRLFLNERKNVDSQFGFTQLGKHWFGIVQKFVVVRVEARNTAQSPLDLNFPVANIHTRYPSPHPFWDFTTKIDHANS